MPPLLIRFDGKVIISPSGRTAHLGGSRRNERERTSPLEFLPGGGVDQPRLDTGADLLDLENLDQKLWVALSCPVKGLDLDEKTLALIDTDRDGRVRANE